MFVSLFSVLVRVVAVLFLAALVVGCATVACLPLFSIVVPVPDVLLGMAGAAVFARLVIGCGTDLIADLS